MLTKISNNLKFGLYTSWLVWQIRNNDVAPTIVTRFDTLEGKFIIVLASIQKELQVSHFFVIMNKPALKINDQIAMLKSRGMLFKDDIKDQSMLKLFSVSSVCH
ncbi:MAG: hypothetical protein FWH18_05180 [Marinilabiliaceae bacterium]|nr:hypothetical protein [Marinilabiliaceae bacterium]